MSRRGAASIVASPVLVGAVTVLVSIVASILAYNANQGLPFIPTYTVSATIPGGANLVEGNEVRVGGFRVGVVDRIGPQMVKNSRGEDKAVAVVRLKLDKVVEELPLDTKVLVRPRSALGLKYVELTPGSTQKGFRPGSTIPLKNAEGPVEFDDFLATFEEESRDNSRAALEYLGDALAGRGPSINETLVELRPFFVHLSPVMQSLSDPRTEVDRFFQELGETLGDIARSCDRSTGPRRLPGDATPRIGSALDAQSPECAQPVAVVQARLFSEMADTFEAIGRYPDELRELIDDTVPTIRTSEASFAVQKPFLSDFADLSRRLRPAARALPGALPPLNDALVVGQEVLPRTVALNQRTERLLRALEDLNENPNTLLALKDFTQTVRVGAPFVEYLAPYQSVCNYFTISFTNLGEHLSEPVDDGFLQRVLAKSGPNSSEQDDTLFDSNADRPADVPADMDPQDAQIGDQEGFKEVEEEVDRRLNDLERTLRRVRGLSAGGALPEGVELPGGLEDMLGDVDNLTGPEIDMIVTTVTNVLNTARGAARDLADAERQDLTSFHNQFYQPAIDGEGNADCQNGQNGFPDRLVTTGRYPPSDDPERNGGSHVVFDSNTPGLAGTTFSGVPSLQDVDEEQRSRHPRGEVPADRPQKPNSRGVTPDEPEAKGARR
jgi:virulence factor Mce-like protein